MVTTILLIALKVFITLVLVCFAKSLEDKFSANVKSIKDSIDRLQLDVDDPVTHSGLKTTSGLLAIAMTISYVGYHISLILTMALWVFAMFVF